MLKLTASISHFIHGFCRVISQFPCELVVLPCYLVISWLRLHTVVLQEQIRWVRAREAGPFRVPAHTPLGSCGILG